MDALTHQRKAKVHCVYHRTPLHPSLNYLNNKSTAPLAGQTILFNKKTIGGIILLNETARIPIHNAKLIEVR